MEAGGRRSSSHLFLVRIWAQPDLRGLPTWRGKLQHIPSGEAHSFEDWTSLVVFLLLLSGGARTGVGEPMPPDVVPSIAWPEPVDQVDLPCTTILSEGSFKSGGS